MPDCWLWLPDVLREQTIPVAEADQGCVYEASGEAMTDREWQPIENNRPRCKTPGCEVHLSDYEIAGGSGLCEHCAQDEREQRQIQAQHARDLAVHDRPKDTNGTVRLPRRLVRPCAGSATS